MVPGSKLLNVFVVLKVAALAVLIAVGLLFSGVLDASQHAAAPGSQGSLAAFGAALIPIVFAYGGWQSANYVAEEIKDPKRILPISLIAGTAIVALVYVTINFAYLKALGLGGLAATTTPASDAARLLFGAAGDRFVTAAIAISTFGFLSLSVLAPTRVYYAMAADGAFLPALAKLHPKYGVPGAAIILQAVWSIALALTGSYDQLLAWVVFADWIFFGLTVAGLFILRARLPPTPGYRTPGYPFVPIFFVAVAMIVVYSAIQDAPDRSLKGAGLLLAGVPVFYFFKWWTSRKAAAPGAASR